MKHRIHLSVVSDTLLGMDVEANSHEQAVEVAGRYYRRFIWKYFERRLRAPRKAREHRDHQRYGKLVHALDDGLHCLRIVVEPNYHEALTARSGARLTEDDVDRILEELDEEVGEDIGD